MRHTIDELTRTFQAHYGLVVEVARRYAPVPDLTYDVVQQTFIEFIQGAQKHDWNLDKGAERLLFEIAKNVATTLWRKENRQKTLARQALEQRLLDPIAPERATGEADVQARKNDALRDCLQRLAPRSRRMIEKHYFEGTTMEQIAREVQGSPNTIRQIFCRIRAKLRTCIEQHLKER